MTIEIVIDTVGELKHTFYINRKQVQKEISEMTDTDITSISDLKSCIKASIKRNRFKNTRIPKYWWSPIVDETWKAKTEARRSFNRIYSQENLINFKKKAAIFQRLKREEIRKKNRRASRRSWPLHQFKGTLDKSQAINWTQNSKKGKRCYI